MAWDLEWTHLLDVPFTHIIYPFFRHSLIPDFFLYSISSDRNKVVSTYKLTCTHKPYNRSNQPLQKTIVHFSHGEHVGQMPRRTHVISAQSPFPRHCWQADGYGSLSPILFCPTLPLAGVCSYQMNRGQEQATWTRR